MKSQTNTRLNPEMEKYVKIRGSAKAPVVYLTIENQSFCVSPHGCESIEDAEWFRDMLCIALARLVSREMHDRLTP